MKEWDDELLDEMRDIGDELADDVLHSVFEHHDVDRCRTILRSLIDHDDPRAADLPDGLSDYLAETSTLPEWVDLERLRRGQAVFERWGVAISVALFCASLPSAYACAKGVRVLAQTARLETDTRRRVMETGQFLIDALGPGGLEPSGKGIVAIQRVRLMHAAIRQLILTHQRAGEAAAVDGDDQPGGPATWDDEWGHPINQEDLAGTLLSFSYTVVEPLPRLGIDLPEDDREDYLYVWRVIGHLLGLRDEMIPETTEESTALVTLIRKRQYGHSDDGVAMANALRSLLDEMTPAHYFGKAATRAVNSVISDLIRMLIGDEAAGILELPPTARHYGWLRRALIFMRITTHDIENDRILRLVANHVGWNVLNGMFDFERQGEHRTDFEIPDHLANGWGLDTPLTDADTLTTTTSGTP